MILFEKLFVSLAKLLRINKNFTVNKVFVLVTKNIPK